MAIYGAFGSELKILRLAVLADVQKLDNRKPDKHDKERLKLEQYVVTKFADSDEERLYDLARLRADGGWREIEAAVNATKQTSVT